MKVEEKIIKEAKKKRKWKGDGKAEEKGEGSLTLTSIFNAAFPAANTANPSSTSRNPPAVPCSLLKNTHLPTPTPCPNTL